MNLSKMIIGSGLAALMTGCAHHGYYSYYPNSYPNSRSNYYYPYGGSSSSSTYYNNNYPSYYYGQSGYYAPGYYNGYNGYYNNDYNYGYGQGYNQYNYQNNNRVYPTYVYPSRSYNDELNRQNAIENSLKNRLERRQERKLKSDLLRQSLQAPAHNGSVNVYSTRQYPVNNPRFNDQNNNVYNQPINNQGYPEERLQRRLEQRNLREVKTNAIRQGLPVTNTNLQPGRAISQPNYSNQVLPKNVVPVQNTQQVISERLTNRVNSAAPKPQVIRETLKNGGGSTRGQKQKALRDSLR